MEMKFAAVFSILSNSIIIVLKIFAGIISGSISIISEAIHSGADLLGSLIAFFAVIKSGEPADKEHPYGHGKYEDISGFIEGGLIVFAGMYIIAESIKKLYSGGDLKSEPILGIFVMAFSVFANLIVSSYLFYIAKKYDSVSLYADAQHLRTDVISSLGVLFGLIIMKYTGFVFMDPLIGIIVACFIIKTGIEINKSAMNDLLDGSLPQCDIDLIEKILNETKHIEGYKNLKCRKQGRCKDIEFTLLFKSYMSIENCHKICDEIENKINEKFFQTHIMIHLEPVKTSDSKNLINS